MQNLFGGFGGGSAVVKKKPDNFMKEMARKIEERNQQMEMMSDAMDELDELECEAAMDDMDDNLGAMMSLGA